MSGEPDFIPPSASRSFWKSDLPVQIAWWSLVAWFVYHGWV